MLKNANYDAVCLNNWQKCSGVLVRVYLICFLADSCNSPFLSGFESRSSSLARLPNSASILNSSEGGGDEGDLSVMHDHENSSPTESDSLSWSKMFIIK